MGQELRDKNDRMEKTMLSMQKITPCLWFDHQAEEAARFYTSIFRNSKILNISYYGGAGFMCRSSLKGFFLPRTESSITVAM